MEARHAKEEHYTANIPADAFYKEQINTLQKKLDAQQTENELKSEYIDGLEKANKALSERVNHLRDALANMIEEKYGNV